MKSTILREWREHIVYWSQKYYVPKWFRGELLFGLTPEGEQGLRSLQENKQCEECSKSLWHCTCAVELDALQQPL